MSLPPLSLLSTLLLPRLPTVMMNFSLRISHSVLPWFCVMVMLRFLSRAPMFLAFNGINFVGVRGRVGVTSSRGG
jgi:hypothetical protein